MDFKHTIVFDVNGNDKGVLECFLAAQEFANNNPTYKIKLVGDVAELKELNNFANIELIENKNKPTDPKNIRKTLQENTSMNQAIEILKNNEADGIISSGDSGSYLSALTLKMKRLQNVSRPAFMPVANAINGQKFVFMDVGANLETKPEYLIEWAKLASAFYQTMFATNYPRVALLNIGTEDYKGPEATKKAHQYLTNDKSINYVGFHETRDVFRGHYDVAIIDGYAGNIMLKSYEGAISTFKDTLKTSIMSKLKYKLGALLLKGAFKEVAATLDYRSVGSAWVVGVNALAVKTHGASDKKAYLSGLNSLKNAIENNLLNKLQKATENLEINLEESE
ncbi:phosphate acyltransferase PlsX [Mycoplasma sp. Pen4]|uniref:phosphate acyltransferase PlsX n=1 Tax=Mycoplasma sp. Pen4 TaxID=640330 RepID=UPI001653FB80|nr:phosphate acyltransferase PlsX [Mycoplasma sp. Pen4]QNM93943.1 phosphate acyltransferase PlsX [Mycoplasma sp. Pen4]